MDSLLVFMSARKDERLLLRSLIGRLLFIFVATSFDANWGIAPFSLTALIARAFPHEQLQADNGDTDGEAFIAEAKRELRAMIEDGLFIVGESSHGEPCIAYTNWARYHQNMKRRGSPSADLPCCAEIADTRDWSKIHPNSIPALERWARAHNIYENVFENGKPKVLVCTWSDQGTAEGGPRDRPVVQGYRETVVQGEGGQVVMSPSLSQSEDHSTENPNSDIPERAEKALRDCGIDPKQVHAWSRHMIDSSKATGADVLTCLLAHCVNALDRQDQTKAAGVVDARIRGGDLPTPKEIEKARKLLDGEDRMKEQETLRCPVTGIASKTLHLAGARKPQCWCGCGLQLVTGDEWQQTHAKPLPKADEAEET